MITIEAGNPAELSDAVTSDAENAQPGAAEPDAAESSSGAEPEATSAGGTETSTGDTGPLVKPRGKPLVQATGRRKSAVARVRLRHGSGAIVINNRRFEDYFPSATHRMVATEPLRVVSAAEDYDVHVTMDGGGISGQAGALRLGIARGLVAIDPELRPALKRAGLLTRDAREKESKKYGLKKARKAPQYSKR
jgi:small subunit ribosomal protein S9